MMAAIGTPTSDRLVSPGDRGPALRTSPRTPVPPPAEPRHDFLDEECSAIERRAREARWACEWWPPD
jgi:hypothetical protein